MKGTEMISGDMLDVWLSFLLFLSRWAKLFKFPPCTLLIGFRTGNSSHGPNRKKAGPAESAWLANQMKEFRILPAKMLQRKNYSILFSPADLFLCPFLLSLALTNCTWVSKDAWSKSCRNTSAYSIEPQEKGNQLILERETKSWSVLAHFRTKKLRLNKRTFLKIVRSTVQRRKWSPNWTANDPSESRGIACSFNVWKLIKKE